MSEISIKCFAGLAEQLGVSETQLPWQESLTVQSVWDVIAEGRPVPSNLLCALNMEYCQLSDAVAAGDEVAFFPPVSGG